MLRSLDSLLHRENSPTLEALTLRSFVGEAATPSVDKTSAELLRWMEPAKQIKQTNISSFQC